MTLKVKLCKKKEDSYKVFLKYFHYSKSVLFSKYHFLTRKFTKIKPL